MLILLLLAIPLVGVLRICTSIHLNDETEQNLHRDISLRLVELRNSILPEQKAKGLKLIALQASLLTLLVSLVIATLHHGSSNTYQFVQELHELSYFNLYLGVDGLSLYFVLLTTIIMPVSLLSN